MNESEREREKNNKINQKVYQQHRKFMIILFYFMWVFFCVVEHFWRFYFCFVLFLFLSVRSCFNPHIICWVFVDLIKSNWISKIRLNTEEFLFLLGFYFDDGRKKEWTYHKTPSNFALFLIRSDLCL